MSTRQRSGGWVLVMAAAVLLSASPRAPAQMNTGNVPDPSWMLALVPDAANAGPPPCIRTGTRLTYWAMSASVRGSYRQLVQDPNGRWIDQQTGQRYAEKDVPSASAGGYPVLQVGYVDNQVAQLSSKFYLFDISTRTSGYSSSRGLVAHAGCAEDYWIHPAVLQKVPTVNRPDLRILRMPFKAGDRLFKNAIVFHSESMQGYKMRAYDLDTGLMIAHGSRSQGAPVYTAPFGKSGQAGTGAGTTMLTSGWLLEVKNVDMPWQQAAPPAWVGQFQRLVYSGTQSSLVPSCPPFSLPMTVTISPKARGRAWVRYTSNTTIQSLQGIPPQKESAEGATGPGTIGGLWMPPQALAAMRPGQVLDRNDITKTTTAVTRAGGGSVTISESGVRHRIDCTYNASTGVLSAMSIAQKIGQATVTQQYQLARGQ